MLSWLRVARLKWQPTNCEFFKPNVVYLGQEISKEGIQLMVVRLKLSRTGSYLLWLQREAASYGLWTIIGIS